MNHFETISFFTNKHFKFLITEFGFKFSKKQIAKELYIKLKNKKSELEFITELGNLTLPIFNFKCFGINFDLKKLSHGNELEKIVSENYKRTIPIMNEIIENYLETKEFNQEKWSEDFDEYGE
ncbi:hypothetical protein [Tenacibaculum aquimarinum]|uniref:hypothetical protein n=1 Tax=Tenacibaculum aquimarinum TaxID=2910675 RepID=UPI001F0A0E5F|nr:hypothetical protein [Tenacibaculum aquimarinum]MCH3885375.1 hypothetical protein [Tenacibaculum aquimarinum]